MSNKRLIDGTNLIETIEKALNQEIPVEWHKDGPTWLRALLEENKQLDEERKFRFLEGAQLGSDLRAAQLMIETLHSGLQQTREELEQEKKRFLQQWQRAVLVEQELEKVKAERDAYLDGLRWYAEKEYWNHDGFGGPVGDGGTRARRILSQYPPRREEDET